MKINRYIKTSVGLGAERQWKKRDSEREQRKRG